MVTTFDIPAPLIGDADAVAARAPIRDLRPPLPDDRDMWWVTGRCHLYCMRPDVPVAWLGPALLAAGQVPLYACAPCRRALYLLVEEDTRRRDQAPAGAVPGGRHRRPSRLEALRGAAARLRPGPARGAAR